MACTEKYILNSELQEMQLGEGEGTVLYDPATENTHVLDEVAQDIIEMFNESGEQLNFQGFYFIITNGLVTYITTAG